MNLTECNWNDVPELWNEAERLWNNVCPIIEEITGGRGGKASPEDTLAEFNKLDKKKKRRILRVILYYKGERFSQQREVRDDLGVTVEDMRLLIEKYGEWKRQRELRVTVDNVKVE
jgi:hypothetical protein